MSGQYSIYLRHEVEFSGVYTADSEEEALRMALPDAREEWADEISSVPVEDIFSDVEDYNA